MSKFTRNILTLLLIAMSGVVTVSANSGVRGDINGDGVLTLADADMLCNMLVGLDNTAQTPFNTNFDNDNSKFSISDVTSLVKVINNKSEGGLDVGIGEWEDGGEDLGGTVCIVRNSADAENVAEVMVHVGYSSFNGFQLDIRIPEGCKLVPYGKNYVKFVDEQQKHVLTENLLDGNLLRVAGYTTDNKPYVNADNFISFQITTDADAFPHVFRVGYSDAALSKSSDCTGTDISIPDYSYAEYILTFRADGAVIQSGYCQEGTTLDTVAPEAPAKKGYVFKKWKDMPLTMPGHDLTLDAEYDLVSGVAEVENGEVRFAVEGPDLTVRNLPADAEYKVYDLTGRLVYSGNAARITLPGDSIFIVDVFHHTLKIRTGR